MLMLLLKIIMLLTAYLKIYSILIKIQNLKSKARWAKDSKFKVKEYILPLQQGQDA